ncbi:MAG TPA: DM13 domain-containing protein [Acidimicrobiales bacterium]|nr:DM13 domain-containing protein [Acidimicrobiales bacterium]
MRRRTLLALTVLALVLSGCGGDSDGESSAGGPATTAAQAGGGADTTVAGPKSAARWETVSTFNGSGAFTTPEFTILANAIQWRVRFTCTAGTLRINSIPPPRRPGAVADAACPKEDTGYSIVTGPVRMQIEATGAWKAVVDQQVDTPLDEPLLAGMTPDRVVAQGSFYKVEVRGEGTAKLYRMPDGKRILRFENFTTGENTDLFVWLSEVAKPANSAQAITSPHVEISNLKSTIGNQNYEIPASIPTEKIKSIVIWCQPVQIAYAAVALA